MPAQDQVVNFEGTEHHFPSDFTDADISKALQSAHSSPPIGIRPQTPWESIKSRFSEFAHDPIHTLLAPIPGSENYSGAGDPILQTALGGIAPGGATLREFLSLPKSKGLAKITQFPGKLLEAFSNAHNAGESVSTLRVAKAAQDEIANRWYPPSPAPTYMEPPPTAATPIAPVGPRLPEGYDAAAANTRARALITRPGRPTGIPSLEDIHAIQPPTPWTAPPGGNAPMPPVQYVDVAPVQITPTSPRGPAFPEGWTPQIHPDYLPGTAPAFTPEGEFIPPEGSGTGELSVNGIGVPWGPAPAHLPELPQGYKDLFHEHFKAGQIPAAGAAMKADATHSAHLYGQQGVTRSAWDAADLAQKNAWLKKSNQARADAGIIKPSSVNRAWGSDAKSTASLARIRELLPAEIPPVQ